MPEAKANLLGVEEGPGEQQLQELFRLNFNSGFTADAAGAKQPVNSRQQPTLVEGVDGKAAFFSSGQVLQYASGKNLNKSEGSISMWVKIQEKEGGASGGPLTLLSEDGPGAAGNNSFKIEMFPGRLIRFSLKDPKDSYIYYHKIGDWHASEWHHLAVTWHAKKGALIYVDGKPSSIGWMPQWTPKTYPHFFIGAANAQGEQACHTTIDDFIIYNRALTEDEARAMFLKYGDFSADISFKDPFLRASEAGAATMVLSNAGEESISLKQLKFTISDKDGNVVQQKALQDQAIGKLNHSVLKVPVTLTSPGAYTFTLYYHENNKEKKVSAPVQVLAKRDQAKQQAASQILITEVNAAEQKPVGEAGSTVVVSSPIGAYREAGAKVHNRFALDFEVEELDAPHVAVITYPDDKPRSMEIMLQHFNSTIDFQSHTGVVTGEEYPVSGKMKEFRIVFWPRSKRQAFIFMTTENNYPAAVKDIKVYKINDFKVASQAARFNGSVPARSSGLYYEDPVLFHNFGTGRDLEGFTKATDRLLEYMQSFGQTEFEYPLAWYAGPLYGTAVEPFQPDIDGAQGGQRPHPDGYPAYLLKRLGEQNMKFTAGLHIHTLPSLNKYALADTSRINRGEETVININKDGKLWYGYWHGADPNYNAADPRVMASVDAIVQEVCERYAHEPAFDGISLVMARPKLFTFGSLASGYNDSNLQRFQEEAQLKIPIYKPGDPKRFENSYKWLMNNPEAKKAWIDWRCKVLYQHYAAMSKKMAAYRPDLKLKLNVFVHLTNNQRLADYLTEPPVEVMREMGIDPALYKDHPTIVLNHTYVPADLRWKRSHYPPANHEVNRTVMTAPEVVASMQDMSNMRVTIHDRYWEDAIGKEQPLPGLKAIGVNEMVWRASTLNAAGYHSLEPYVFALNHLDATSIVKGGYVVGTYGMEEELLRFSEALQALPAVKFENVAGIADPVRVRQQMVDGKLYFYVLNTLPEPVEIKLKLAKSDKLLEPVVQKTRKKSKTLTLALQPYDLRVFESTFIDQKVVSGESKLSKVWLEQLHSSLESLEKVAQEKHMQEGKSAPYLSLAKQCWENKHYARLYFLLQEDWAKDIERRAAAATSSLNEN
ncbi:LamG domain-containing protein [Pontibacter sp. SGAir0037]|uniref:LamG domain-containing protein n=1 Tax=Pontibacter sp. SGAir0037 TaxID=2571030 RepID=UPI00143CDB64|nr:LamG domain-containing protein [Pontibacter sp. SGAir0037]